MQVITCPKMIQKIALNLRRQGRKIALVPTMGCLHKGHMSLVRLARKQADVVMLSIFVNPMQFGPDEDFMRYPRNFTRDRAVCKARKVDFLFYPSAEDMYSRNSSVRVGEDKMSQLLCGKSRPGHFRGVLTVVAKLFNLMLPDIAVFGQKDAQQLRLIRQMAADLNFPVQIITGPTVREKDGLALSSRNRCLSASERKQALCLVHALQLARKLYRAGARYMPRVIHQMTGLIRETPSARIDYIDIVDPRNLQSLVYTDRDVPFMVALAVWIGKTRLIDNLLLPDDRLSNLPAG